MIDLAVIEIAAERIRVRFRASAPRFIIIELEVGQIVLAVREDPVLGDPAVKRIARAVGLGARYLNQLAIRAKAFSRADIERALRLAKRHDFVLWTGVLDELATVAEARDRHLLLRQVIRERWTIEDLLKELRARKRKLSASVALLEVAGRADAFLNALSALDESSAVEYANKDRYRVATLIDRLTFLANAAPMHTEGEAL